MLVKTNVAVRNLGNIKREKDMQLIKILFVIAMIGHLLCVDDDCSRLLWRLSVDELFL